MPPRRVINQRRVAEEDELDRRIEQIIDTRLERRLDMIVDQAERMGTLIEAQQEVDPRRRRVPNPTADLEDVEYDSYSEGDANIFTEENPSDDAFFLAGGDGEPEFDEEKEIEGQEDTVLPNDGSDDFDLLELWETGVEFCQGGSFTCSVPFKIYDLPNLEDVLSVNVWSECLTEEERLGLTKILPDMDQETYMRTMMELFKGCNFHFGNPLKKLFDMLKGGLCEPRVGFFHEGRNSFDKREHYHFLKMHQNGGYSIDEKFRVLNIMKSQKSLMCKKETLWDYKKKCDSSDDDNSMANSLHP
ncbi:hypothetical protein CDL15_Pgr011977 [Punica granatum]|uniref:DEUBAD domain-containing protein n=1 Tax=Punica granatum TaxID=22663 RepID=A0A218WE83_PUNGR|nr:hypothetical protein CDL15_Pgr011977 [Punica granatum]